MRDGWQELPLGSLVNRRTDFVPVVPDQDYTILGVQRSGWGFVEREPIKGSDQKFTKLMRVSEDDLVYRTITAFEAPAAVVGQREAGKFVTPQTFPVFRIDHSRMLPRFMEALTTWPAFHEEMSSRCTGSVLRRKTLSIGAFESIPIALPPLDEQRRIVDLVGALDDTIAAAEESAQQLTEAMVHLPAAVAHRGHDLGWESGVLKDILGGESTIRTGPFGSQLHQSDYVEDGPVAVVMPANMRRGRVELSGAARILETDAIRLARHVTRAGDILWSRRGDVTRFAVIDDASEGSLCGTGCFLLRPEDPEMTSWLEVILSSPETGRWLVDNAVGATMANLNRTILGNIPVVIPPLADRMALSEAWSSMRTADRALAVTITILRDVRSNLLTALLSGEHEIPESYDELMEGAAA